MNGEADSGAILKTPKSSLGVQIPGLVPKIAAFAFSVALLPMLSPLSEYWNAWPIGAIFGAVVIIWRARSYHDLIQVRSFAFLIASTSIFVLVYWVATDIFSDPLLFASIAGAILLSVVDGLLLKAPWRRVLIAMVVVPVAWWFSTDVLDAFPNAPSTAWIGNWVNVITLWQAAYLVCMFATKPDSYGRWFEKEA